MFAYPMNRIIKCYIINIVNVDVLRVAVWQPQRRETLTITMAAVTCMYK